MKLAEKPCSDCWWHHPIGLRARWNKKRKENVDLCLKSHICLSVCLLLMPLVQISDSSLFNSSRCTHTSDSPGSLQAFSFGAGTATLILLVLCLPASWTELLLHPLALKATVDSPVSDSITLPNESFEFLLTLFLLRTLTNSNSMSS